MGQGRGTRKAHKNKERTAKKHHVENMPSVENTSKKQISGGV